MSAAAGAAARVQLPGAVCFSLLHRPLCSSAVGAGARPPPPSPTPGPPVDVLLVRAGSYLRPASAPSSRVRYRYKQQGQWRARFAGNDETGSAPPEALWTWLDGIGDGLGPVSVPAAAHVVLLPGGECDFRDFARAGRVHDVGRSAAGACELGSPSSLVSQNAAGLASGG